ncbi:MAG TPA: hypothetical protein VEA69_23125 [Tepidisphaeraceae bacterium]|nr:hypothetical protein [Tepidisphaeraceae bacterium]
MRLAVFLSCGLFVVLVFSPLLLLHRSAAIALYAGIVTTSVAFIALEKLWIARRSADRRRETVFRAFARAYFEGGSLLVLDPLLAGEIENLRRTGVLARIKRLFDMFPASSEDERSRFRELARRIATALDQPVRTNEMTTLWYLVLTHLAALDYALLHQDSTAVPLARLSVSLSALEGGLGIAPVAASADRSAFSRAAWTSPRS